MLAKMATMATVIMSSISVKPRRLDFISILIFITVFGSTNGALSLRVWTVESEAHWQACS